MKYLSISRGTFLLILFLYPANRLSAQNRFRDDELRDRKENKQLLKGKIQEIRIYLFHYKDTVLGADSMLIGKYDYDTNGRLTERINYFLSQYGPSVPPVTAHFINVYDHKGNIIQHCFYVVRHSLSNGKIMAPSLEDSQSVTYHYDENNRLIKDLDDLNTFIAHGPVRERLGTGITTYRYDESGNLILKISHDLDHKFNNLSEYIYDGRNRLIRILTYIDSAATEPFIKQDYRYIYSNKQLTKLESIYKNSELVSQREFVYDKKGNQLQGYQVIKGIRKEVWNYKYNRNNQVIESVGGPGRRFGPGYRDPFVYHFRNQMTEALGPANTFQPYSMDVRCDGVAHLFYTYDKKGNLTEIKKYEKNHDGDEELTMAEKFYYVRYK
jgi:hypothetical protein